MREVKFYSKDDLSIGWNLTKVEEIYKGFNVKATCNLNEILELYNCTIYIDNKLFLKKWDDDDLSCIKTTNKEVKMKIARYFNELNGQEVLEDLKEVQFNFKEDFLELFFRFKVNQRIPNELIINWLDEGVFRVYTLCGNKQFVKFYGDITRDLLLRDSSNAEIVIEKYLKDFPKETIYLPEIDDKSLCILLTKYIDSSEVNLNYLTLLMNAKSIQGFNISSEIRLKAKKKIEELNEQYFKVSGTGLRFEYIVSFVRDLGKPMTADIGSETGIFKINIDKNWLEEELDFFIIIYNFVWLFNFMDSNGRITLVNLNSEASALEDALGITGKFDYKTNQSFSSKQVFSLLQLSGYYDLLQSNKIELERVLEWYFNNYIRDEFKVENYIVELPSKHATYREKCLTLFSEMEYILAQFDSFVKYKFVNQELIAINSNGILFSQIPSFIEKKHIYATQTLKNIMFHLFSDQSGLTYINENLKAKSFFELVSHNEIIIKTFHEHQQRLIQQLVDLSYLRKSNDGYIVWENPKKIFIMKDLYENEVVIYNRIDETLQKEIDGLLNVGLVRFESGLFSKLEQDYFDYHLNNHKFQNGLQLRNKYMHRRVIQLDEKQHKQNYIVGLKLLISIVLKINEEFCIAADNGVL